MIGLLQRVSHARVEIDGQTVAEIDRGLLVLVGVEQGDAELEAEKLLDRLLDYRVFADEAGKMNHSLRDIQGGLLLVPQFTLLANTHKGTRPDFSHAAKPAEARWLFEYMGVRANCQYPHVASGIFGANMQVSLTNDGPVTFWLRVEPEVR
ncbi:MAG: D-aminoacyl-tRNA deacylase [Halothiobacillaceae bacterium]